MKNHLSVGWFEIPVIDMDRAITFYNLVFDIDIKKQQFGEFEMGWFPFDYPSDPKGAAGTLVKSDGNYKPSTDGTLIYLSCVDLKDEIGRIEKAGGKILQERTQISEEHGFMGIFVDTEGNRIALHSKA